MGIILKESEARVVENTLLNMIEYGMTAMAILWQTNALNGERRWSSYEKDMWNRNHSKLSEVRSSSAV